MAFDPRNCLVVGSRGNSQGAAGRCLRRPRRYGRPQEGVNLLLAGMQKAYARMQISRNLGDRNLDRKSWGQSILFGSPETDRLCVSSCPETRRPLHGRTSSRPKPSPEATGKRANFISPQNRFNHPSKSALFPMPASVPMLPSDQSCPKQLPGVDTFVAGFLGIVVGRLSPLRSAAAALVRVKLALRTRRLFPFRLQRARMFASPKRSREPAIVHRGHRRRTGPEVGDPLLECPQRIDGRGVGGSSKASNTLQPFA